MHQSTETAGSPTFRGSDRAFSTRASGSDPDTDSCARSAPGDLRALLATTAVAAGGTVMWAALGAAAPLWVLPLTALPVLGATAWFAPRHLAPAHAGTVLWWALVLATTAVVLRAGGTERHGVAAGLAVAALQGGLAAAAWLRQEVRKGTPVASAARDAAGPFLHPPSGVVPALIGAGMALPLAGTQGGYLRDTDSGWIVASTRHVATNGFDLLQQSQDVLLPYITLGPILAAGGIDVAVLVMIGALLALAALTAYLGYRITGAGTGAIVATAALLAMPPIANRAGLLTMYAPALGFAYLAGWGLHRAMATPGRRRWLWAAVAGLALVVACEAHAIGQVFLLVPLVLLPLHPWRQAGGPLAVTLATVAVTSVPRLLINLSEGGLDAVRTNRADFVVQQGYLDMINSQFHDQNVDTSPLAYLRNIPTMAEGFAGGRGMLLLLAIPVAVAALRAGWRSRIFVAVAAAALVAALAITAPATYARYLAPLAVGVAILVAVGVVTLLRERGTPRTVGGIFVAVLVFAAVVQMSHTVTSRTRQQTTVAEGPLPSLAAAVDNDRHVLGVRSHLLNRVDPTISTEFTRTMSEEDVVTYLTWPSDEAVTDLMERLDAGWVLVHSNRRREKRYHETWLEPVYGRPARHPEMIASSDAFCLAANVNGNRLYRYGECRPGDAGTDLAADEGSGPGAAPG